MRILLVLICCSRLLLSLGKVVEVNITNYFDFFTDAPALLEFYAPWCANCVQFEKPYEMIAKRLQASDKSFKVGRVDMSANPALASLFSIEWVPVFYLYRDRKLYRLEGSLTTESILTYCQSSYSSDHPIDSLSSPLGLLGVLKSSILRLGLWADRSLRYLCEDLGLPFWQAIFATMLIGILVVALLTGATIFLAVRQSSRT